MAINDIYTDGLARGWRITNAARLTEDQTLDADVVIVGSGAGGGTAAEILSAAGLDVLMLEEGALYTSADFKQLDEYAAYTQLYQEGAGRTTSDGAVVVFQGRAVGGTTTVNWTTSLRTPPATLAHWAEHFGVKNTGAEDLAPWFTRMEERLGVAPWAMAANANNAALARGCDALGIHWKTVPRNVRGCWNLGYCGLGCPVNAKQSMLVTTIPAALDRGMRLIHHARVEQLEFDARQRVTALKVRALQDDTLAPGNVSLTVRARHVVLAGGAINTPALLLRSKAPDPHGLIGRRSCIHPVNVSIARFDEIIDGFYGAPQSVYSDHFLWPGQGVGYKLEVPPLQPMLMSGIFGSHGAALTRDMAALNRTQVNIALLRDGFGEDSPGGQVRIDDHGQPLLDYDFSQPMWDSLRHAFLSMAELQFAAGARSVRPGHLDAGDYTNWDSARKAINALPMQKFRTALFTAHLMGGCAMGEDRNRCVVDSLGNFHDSDNLSVFDGSVFPTSIGANPQLSIYALIARNATALAERMGRASSG